MAKIEIVLNGVKMEVEDNYYNYTELLKMGGVTPYKNMWIVTYKLGRLQEGVIKHDSDSVLILHKGMEIKIVHSQDGGW